MNNAMKNMKKLTIDFDENRADVWLLIAYAKTVEGVTIEPDPGEEEQFAEGLRLAASKALEMAELYSNKKTTK